MRLHILKLTVSLDFLRCAILEQATKLSHLKRLMKYYESTFVSELKPEVSRNT